MIGPGNNRHGDNGYGSADWYSFHLERLLAASMAQRTANLSPTVDALAAIEARRRLLGVSLALRDKIPTG